MKKVLSILFSVLLISTFSSGVAHAEVAEDFNSMKTGNTWIELEKANTDIFGDSKIAAVPKGVLKPEETKIPDAIKKIGGQDAVDQTLYFSYSTGIHSDDGKPALSPLLKMLKEYKPESATDDPAVPMTDNPMFYGDLSYNNDTTSKDVKISAGDNLSSLKLTLSNMNWLSQPIFSELSGHDMYRSEKDKGTLRFLTDSQLVYTIKFPKGFDISKATATSDASSDLLTLSTSVSGEVKTGMTLTVTLRRKGAGETFLTEDQFKNELNSLNTISVSMKDIAITKDAVEGKNVVTGSIGGFLEYMNVGGSTYDEVRQNKGLTWTYIHYFAAPQEASGKDSNLAANDSQYKIQYTFDVVKPAQNTVTFKDDDKTHATVKVETGKAIDTDALTGESMPKDPTKAGYVFKEWNTKADGKGTAFTGKTIVNNDITVYAIFVKKPNNPRPNPNKPVPDRIDGNDRIDTAINISKKHYDRAKTVIVVRHDLFPDSMTASVLAKLKDAPILLNPTNKLDPRVGAEIKRLGASEVIIVGGQNSISEKVREELRIYDADKDVERIAGHDRYGTSEMVARRVVGITGKKNKAVVASGEVFPDALAVGTYASREGYPILLVRKDLVPTQITKAIKDLEIKNTYIAGGYNTISKSTEMKLPGVLERMAGKTRYETAIAIARSKFADSKEVYIASGEEFADALAISPMSGKYNRPTLLVKSKAGQNKIVSDYVYFKNINRITAIGGYRYIPNDVLEELVN